MTVLIKKTRKPRGMKLDGTRSLDLCPHCFSFHCNPMTMSHEFSQKVDKRLRAGLCGACGQNPCACKSTLKTKKELYST